MNHGSAFQALWRQLQQEVRALQNKGYYGDGTTFVPSFRLRSLDSPFSLRVLGYWSSGTRLADSAKIAAQGIEMGELPEYMVFCFLNTLVLLKLKKLVRWCSFQSAACLATAPQI